MGTKPVDKSKLEGDEFIKNFFRLNAKKGGEATKAKYGNEHYVKMALGRWKKHKKDKKD